MLASNTDSRSCKIIVSFLKINTNEESKNGGHSHGIDSTAASGCSSSDVAVYRRKDYPTRLFNRIIAAFWTLRRRFRVSESTLGKYTAAKFDF